MKLIAFLLRFVRSRRGCLGLAAALLSLWPAVALADPVGSVTGLPLPRYASLKTDRVNLREGPSKDHATKWVFQRAGLPVEITAEFEIWRKVRDSEGAEGWVLHSLLSGRRTGLVGVGKKGETLQDLHPAEGERRRGGDAAVGRHRQRAHLRRRLVPDRRRRIQRIY